MAACRTGYIYATLYKRQSGHLGRSYLLPVGAVIKFAPVIPVFDKILDSKSLHPRWMHNDCTTLNANFAPIGIPEVLILMYLSSPILTSLNNGDAIVLGDITLPG